MLEYKLDVDEQKFQLRKKAVRNEFHDAEVGEDGFFKQGRKYESLRSLWSYFKGNKEQITLYVANGVMRTIDERNSIDQKRKDELVRMIESYAVKEKV